MSLRIHDLLLVPFGVESFAAEAVRIAGWGTGGLRLEAPFPLAVIDRRSGVPLRLDAGLLQRAPAAAQTGSPLDEVRAALLRLVPPWDRTAERLVTAYLDAVVQVVAAHRGEIERRYASLAGLFQPDDLVFSAPMPLPRAHLPAPPPPRAEAVGREDFVTVDVAFWTGERLVALLLAGRARTPKAARAEVERLEAAGVLVVPVSPSDLADGAAGLLERALAPIWPRVWEGVALPSGPFPPGPSLV